MGDIAIPEQVRYDSTLPSFAALLYGELMRLCEGGGGKTTVTDGYLASLYGRDKRTVNRYVCLLCERGYFVAEHDGIRRRLKPGRLKRRGRHA